jgi:glyoxylase-like metal-dependent hydrolase (beta-lactamase superfamily II)
MAATPVPFVHSLHHADTGTWTHVVADPASRVAAIIDPVLDYEAKGARTGTTSAEAVLARCRADGLDVRWILETHAHADHLSAAQWLKAQTGAPVCIGAGIRAVQAAFKPIYGLGDEFATDGSQFDRLLDDGARLPLGAMDIEVIATPGHTSDSVSYLVGDALFTGDSLFMPDGGTARCDFPGGDAGTLFASIQRLYALPDATRVFVCHDYGPGGRAVQAQTTIAQEKAANIHVRADTPADAYVALRTARDATLALPALILPAVQVNIRAGRLPPAREDGRRYLSLPLDTL